MNRNGWARRLEGSKGAGVGCVRAGRAKGESKLRGKRHVWRRCAREKVGEGGGRGRGDVTETKLWDGEAKPRGDGDERKTHARGGVVLR